MKACWAAALILNCNMHFSPAATPDTHYLKPPGQNRPHSCFPSRTEAPVPVVCLRMCWGKWYKANCATDNYTTAHFCYVVINAV